MFPELCDRIRAEGPVEKQEVESTPRLPRANRAPGRLREIAEGPQQGGPLEGPDLEGAGSPHRVSVADRDQRLGDDLDRAERRALEHHPDVDKFRALPGLPPP